jgi:hypothetical protein
MNEIGIYAEERMEPIRSTLSKRYLGFILFGNLM